MPTELDLNLVQDCELPYLASPGTYRSWGLGHHSCKAFIKFKDGIGPLGLQCGNAAIRRLCCVTDCCSCFQGPLLACLLCVPRPAHSSGRLTGAAVLDSLECCG